MDTDDIEVDTQYIPGPSVDMHLTTSLSPNVPSKSQSMAVSLIKTNSSSQQPSQSDVHGTCCMFSFQGSAPFKCEMVVHPSVEPPKTETVTTTLSSICFPYFDPTKLRPIDFCAPFPVSRITIESGFSQEYNPSTLSSGSRSRAMVPSTFLRNQLRVARKHALCRIGIHGMSGEKKLLAAVRNGETDTVTRLLGEGVNPNASDNKKRTALHIASSQGAETIVSLLVSLRADPNRQDILGNTPLHLAVCRGDSKIVQLLIGCGANIHLKDNVERTPLCIVRSRLSTLRKDRSISTDKLIGECHMILSILQANSRRHPNSEIPVDTLCNMMKNVSTREQADEVADVMISQMSDLCIDSREKIHRACTEPLSGLSIL
ncbi:unnamed protein product [Lymnaea stagnalis]|uniref:Uncharacterized protein n=1 Tax=Lymnaea stagnalis TaxID=6523 RepID=A0AAV2IB31_LYMST